MPRQPYLSVIIPSYNEATNIQRGALTELVPYLSEQNYSWEIIFTDDGSSDDTVKLLKKFAAGKPQVRVVENIHAGKGPTVQAGMLAATGEWRLFTDFDQSTPIHEVAKLLKHATDPQHILIGSREISGAKRDAEPWYRHLMGRGFNWLVQVLAVPGIMDTQCGFKLFSAPATEDLFRSLYVYGRQTARQDAFTGAFDVELLYLALQKGYAITEIPIIWHHHETNRVSPIRDSLRMLRDIIRIRIADMQGNYHV